MEKLDYLTGLMQQTNVLQALENSTSDINLPLNTLWQLKQIDNELSDEVEFKKYVSGHVT